MLEGPSVDRSERGSTLSLLDDSVVGQSVRLYAVSEAGDGLEMQPSLGGTEEGEEGAEQKRPVERAKAGEEGRKGQPTVQARP